MNEYDAEKRQTDNQIDRQTELDLAVKFLLPIIN